MSKSIACVTGASGAIGSKITALLLSQGYQVRVLSRKSLAAVSGVEVFNGDITDKAVLKSFVQSAQMLFHCAAELTDEAKMWAVNVSGTERILECAESCGIKYFCYFSSIGVIGQTDVRSVDESTSCNPQNLYEKSKWAAEQLVARGIKGCTVVILRPTNVIDEKRLGILALPQRHSMLDIGKIFLTGGECAHIVHAEDVADAAVYFITRPAEGVHCYIVSCDHERLNTPAGIWALYNAYRRGKPVDAVRATPHLPLSVPYFLRRILRGAGNRGDVRYSSKKLRDAGFVFKLGLQGAVSRIALLSSPRAV